MKTMPKKDPSPVEIDPSEQTELVQFNCPVELKAWAKTYASRVRFTNLTAWLISLIVEQKLAYETLTTQGGDQVATIMGLQARERPSPDSTPAPKTPPAHSGAATR
jgi:hypothetical protein